MTTPAAAADREPGTPVRDPAAPLARCQVCGAARTPDDPILCRVCGEPVIAWGWAP